MKFGPTSRCCSGGSGRRFALASQPGVAGDARQSCLQALPAGSAGFTLAEVLAALLFMAIVIPVSVEGLRIASRAGQVGERKVVAARLAERVLNELTVTGRWQDSSQSGTIYEGAQEYRWRLRNDPWNQGTLREVTVEVGFLVQGRDFDVRLSTLLDTASGAVTATNSVDSSTSTR